MINGQYSDYSIFSKTKHFSEILQDKIEEQRKKEAHYLQATYPTCLTSIMVQSCLFINSGFKLALFPEIFLGHSFSNTENEINEFKSNAEMLLGKYREISHFYRLFKDFELNPEDEKVKNVFDQFFKINQDPNWVKFLNEHRLMHHSDLTLFGSTGSVFLMDAVSKFLSDKKINSMVLKNWEHLLTLRFDEIEGEKEPWETIEKLNPELDAYHRFFCNRNNLNSVDLADVMIAIFEDVVEKSLEFNLV